MKFETILNAYSSAHAKIIREMSSYKGENPYVFDLIQKRRKFRDRLLHLMDMAQNKSYCSYCGEVGPRTPEYMAEHVLNCDKRPEMMLANQIIELTKQHAEHYKDVANIAAYLSYRLTFGLIDAKDVEIAKRLEHLDVDFIKIIAGANIDNLPAAIRLAAEELPISIEEVTS